MKRGRIGLSTNENDLLLEIDTDGNESCLLTALDAREVSELMTDYAKQIWETSEEKEEYKQIYTVTTDNKYSWKSTGCELIVGLDKSQESVEIQYQGNIPYIVSVNQAVEIIQALQSYISSETI